MSSMAKAARAAMKSKAKSLTAANDPREKVSSTTWTPPEPLNTEAKTGLRPVSRRAFKVGGKVTGSKAKANMGKAPRANGGKAMSADSFINRNVKDANAERAGIKHVGGMKKGGRIKREDGGSTDAIADYLEKNPAEAAKPVPVPPRRPPNLGSSQEKPMKPDQSKYMPGDTITRGPVRVRKDGGRTKKEIGGPLAGAQKMIQRSVQQAGVPSATMTFGKTQRGSLSPMRATGLKKGGAAHEDVAADKALIRKMVKPSARTGKEGGGGLRSESTQAALARRNARDARLDAISADVENMRAIGQNRPKAERASATNALYDAMQKYSDAEAADKKTQAETGYSSKGDAYSAHLGYRKGGCTKKQGGGGLRSESTQLARAKSDLRSAYDDAKPSYNPIKNISDIASGRAMEKGANLSNALDRSKAAEQETGGYKKGGRTKKQGGGGLGMPKKGSADDIERGLARDLLARSMAEQKLRQARLDNLTDTSDTYNAKYTEPHDFPKLIYPGAGYKKGGSVFSGPSYPGKVPGATGGRTAHASGGRAKGKTDINIVIAAGKSAGPADMMPPGGPVPPPARPVPPPQAGAPAGGAAPMPMPMPAAPAPQGGGQSMGLPPMPRKDGGRISRIAKSFKDMTAGAGSGEGRLQKTDIAKRTMHNKGGKVGHRSYSNYKDMDAGAGSGFGRLEKTEMARKKTGIQMA